MSLNWGRTRKAETFTREAAYNILGNGDEDGIRGRSRLVSDSKAL
jgi:hypothetical protein